MLRRIHKANSNVKIIAVNTVTNPAEDGYPFDVLPYMTSGRAKTMGAKLQRSDLKDTLSKSTLRKDFLLKMISTN